MTTSRLAIALLATFAPALATAGDFERVVIDDAFPGGYQVEVADVNGDGKPDVVGVGGATCAWYENPRWTKRVVSGSKQTPGIISSATRDLDGDGKAEIAVAYEFEMNQPRRGKLLLASQGKTADDPWTFTPFAEVGSIHRLRWGDVDGDKSPDLVVAPLFADSATPPDFSEGPAHVLVYKTGGSARPAGWEKGAVVELPVLHAIDAVDVDGDGKTDVLGASNRGVTLSVFHKGWVHERLAAGAPGDAPKKGSSEVHLGRLRDGRRFLATVEPWHGQSVAVYEAPAAEPSRFGPRKVIDATMTEGHALWVADVDGDGDSEIFAGYRGDGGGVLAFDHDPKTGDWTRALLDPKVAAQDLRGGDLDGDGTPDVVAIGGSTHNVVLYRSRPNRP